jgi:hypothetical protein
VRGKGELGLTMPMTKLFSLLQDVVDNKKSYQQALDLSDNVQEQ